MAVKQGHLLAIGGVAVVALAAGYGVAQATGGEDEPKTATTASKPAELPAVKAAAAVRVASLGAAPALPAPKRPPSSKSGGSSSGGSSGGSSTPQPSSSPAPSTSTPAPQTSTPAPVTPQPTTAPAPERTPVVGGGTGGDEP